MTIHESAGPDGELVRTRLSREHDGLALATGAEVARLPEGALHAVMKHYGKPLVVGEHEESPRDVVALIASGTRVEETLDLGDGHTLVRFRFLRRYDVIARDYLALFRPDGEPLCELAASVTAALDHLARRFAST
jgi:hypothetical protein